MSFARGKAKLKQNHFVHFDDNYTMDNGDEYQLGSVCNHSSWHNSREFGHYTSAIRLFGTSLWKRCDDHHISSQGYLCRDATMMIYSKKTMENRNMKK